MYPDMTDADIQQVIDSITEYYVTAGFIGSQQGDGEVAAEATRQAKTDRGLKPRGEGEHSMDIRTIFRKNLLSLGELTHDQDLDGIWVPDDLTADEVGNCIHALFREKAQGIRAGLPDHASLRLLVAQGLRESRLQAIRRTVADPGHLLRGRQLGDPAVVDLSQGRGDRLRPERRAAGHAQATVGVAGDGRSLRRSCR